MMSLSALICITGLYMIRIMLITSIEDRAIGRARS